MIKTLKAVLLGIAVLLVVAPGAIKACWAAISREEFVRSQPVIVVGEIQRVTVAPKSRYAYDTAYIKVERVLKNSLKKRGVKAGAELAMTMPSINNEMHTSTDIFYSKGQRGIWFLTPEKRKYWAGHPWCLQELFAEPKILSIIHEQKTK